MSDDPVAKSSALVGVIAVGTILIGVASFAVACLAIAKQQFTGAGISLFASAVAFGLLANDVFRK